MTRFKSSLLISFAFAFSCSVPKDAEGGFSAPVGIRMEASNASPAFELAVAANTKEFPAELVSPLSAAVAKALKQCPPPSSSVIGLNLSLNQGVLAELDGAKHDEASRCLIGALKGQQLPLAGNPPLQLMAQLRFDKRPDHAEARDQ